MWFSGGSYIENKITKAKITSKLINEKLKVTNKKIQNCIKNVYIKLIKKNFLKAFSNFF